jgi:TPR repeat protein
VIHAIQSAIWLAVVAGSCLCALASCRVPTSAQNSAVPGVPFGDAGAYGVKTGSGDAGGASDGPSTAVGPDAAGLGCYTGSDCYRQYTKYREHDAQKAMEYGWAAHRLYEAECAHDDKIACVMAGANYHKGGLVARDDEKAESRYQHACDLGDVTGCSRLAEMQCDAYGQAMLRLYPGNEDAEMCFTGGPRYILLPEPSCIDMIEKVKSQVSFTPLHRCLDLLFHACELEDYGFSCEIAGLAYRESHYFEPDPDRALSAFRRGCGDDDMSTCDHLGDAYAAGWGVPRDLDKAIELYRRLCARKVHTTCDTMKRLVEERKRASHAAPAKGSHSERRQHKP